MMGSSQSVSLMDVARFNSANMATGTVSSGQYASGGNMSSQPFNSQNYYIPITTTMPSSASTHPAQQNQTFTSTQQTSNSMFNMHPTSSTTSSNLVQMPAQQQQQSQQQNSFNQMNTGQSQSMWFLTTTGAFIQLPIQWEAPSTSAGIASTPSFVTTTSANYNTNQFQQPLSITQHQYQSQGSSTRAGGVDRGSTTSNNANLSLGSGTTGTASITGQYQYQSVIPSMNNASSMTQATSNWSGTSTNTSGAWNSSNSAMNTTTAVPLSVATTTTTNDAAFNSSQQQSPSSSGVSSASSQSQGQFSISTMQQQIQQHQQQQSLVSNVNSYSNTNASPVTYFQELSTNMQVPQTITTIAPLSSQPNMTMNTSTTTHDQSSSSFMTVPNMVPTRLSSGTAGTSRFIPSTGVLVDFSSSASVSTDADAEARAHAAAFLLSGSRGRGGGGGIRRKRGGGAAGGSKRVRESGDSGVGKRTRVDNSIGSSSTHTPSMISTLSVNVNAAGAVVNQSGGGSGSVNVVENVGAAGSITTDLLQNSQSGNAGTLSQMSTSTLNAASPSTGTSSTGPTVVSSSTSKNDKIKKSRLVKPNQKNVISKRRSRAIGSVSAIKHMSAFTATTSTSTSTVGKLGLSREREMTVDWVSKAFFKMIASVTKKSVAGNGGDCKDKNDSASTSAITTDSVTDNNIKTGENMSGNSTSTLVPQIVINEMDNPSLDRSDKAGNEKANDNSEASKINKISMKWHIQNIHEMIQRVVQNYLSPNAFFTTTTQQQQQPSIPTSTQEPTTSSATTKKPTSPHHHIKLPDRHRLTITQNLLFLSLLYISRLLTQYQPHMGADLLALDAEKEAEKKEAAMIAATIAAGENITELMIMKSRKLNAAKKNSKKKRLLNMMKSEGGEDGGSGGAGGAGSILSNGPEGRMILSTEEYLELRCSGFLGEGGVDGGLGCDGDGVTTTLLGNEGGLGKGEDRGVITTAEMNVAVLDDSRVGKGKQSGLVSKNVGEGRGVVGDDGMFVGRPLKSISLSRVIKGLPLSLDTPERLFLAGMLLAERSLWHGCEKDEADDDVDGTGTGDDEVNTKARKSGKGKGKMVKSNVMDKQKSLIRWRAWRRVLGSKLVNNGKSGSTTGSQQSHQPSPSTSISATSSRDIDSSLLDLFVTMPNLQSNNTDKDTSPKSTAVNDHNVDKDSEEVDDVLTRWRHELTTIEEEAEKMVKGHVRGLEVKPDEYRRWMSQ
ncbi:hypothetical protein HDU76_008319, partial [Blyttiomyces sp. JEL0837]